MQKAEEKQILIPDKETIDRRMGWYDTVRDFVEFPPAGVHQGYPDYDKRLRPHRRAKDTHVLISVTSSKDYEALYLDEEGGNVSLPNDLPEEIGVVIKLHSAEDVTYPSGIWVSYFDPRSERFSPISPPKGCITKSGEIQTLDQTVILSTETIERQFDVLTKAITEGRSKPCEQGLIDRIFHNTIFRK